MKNIYKLAAIAVLAINGNIFQAKAQAVSDFENLTLPADTFWDGRDLSGTHNAGRFYSIFNSGDAIFPNVYDTTWGASWAYWAEGWAYSSRMDTAARNFDYAGYTAVTLQGVAGSTMYAIGKQNSVIQLSGAGLTNPLKGVYVTNTAYAYNSMKYGDSFAKKFTNADKDWFKLRIAGYKNGAMTDSVIFMLADFTHQDSTMDYIVTTWEYIDLSPLGTVDSVQFVFSSSDVGQWGINTPTFVAIDNFNGNQVSNPNGIATVNNLNFTLYPNPAKNRLTVITENPAEYIITNLVGKVVAAGNITNNRKTIDINDMANGIYLITITDKSTHTSTTRKFVVEN